MNFLREYLTAQHSLLLVGRIIILCDCFSKSGLIIETNYVESILCLCQIRINSKFKNVQINMNCEWHYNVRFK